MSEVEEKVPAPVVQNVQQQENVQQQVSDHLALFPGAPTRAQIEQWKKEHGEVNCSGFTDDEIYIWRPLKRKEWVDLQRLVSQMPEKATEIDPELEVVKVCLLWCSDAGEAALLGKAGSLSTLHEQLMQHSNFVNPQVAANLVVKL